MRKIWLELVLTVLAVFCVVTGWLLTSNLDKRTMGPNMFRTTTTVLDTWPVWVGIALLTLGISYFVISYRKKSRLN